MPVKESADRNPAQRLPQEDKPEFMMRRFITIRHTLHHLVERHGGGARGMYSVALRTWKMARVLGIKGVIRRFQGAEKTPDRPPPPSGFHFPASGPITGSALRVGIMVHVYYPELAPELATLLREMPYPYTLLVSVVDEEAAAQCDASFSTLPRLSHLSIKVVANRGRDIAPFFVDFRDEILALDVVAHVHTKKSLYTGSEQSGWRTYLLHSLLGGGHRVSWILGMFVAEPRIGMVYPESFAGLPMWAHTWLGNFAEGSILASQLGISLDPQRYFDFPAGSMFWARVDALRPLLDLGLSRRDFPEEQGQKDGTTQHAVERLLALCVRNAGYVAGVLPADGTLLLTDEGDRNWRKYFQEPLDARLRVASLEAHLVSVDLFDTLVTRPFLYAAGARAYLSDLARTRLEIEDYSSLRKRAELQARARAGKDVGLAQIYTAMAGLIDSAKKPFIGALEELELQTEARLLRIRPQALQSIAALSANGRRIIAVSDMYLNHAQLQRVLPEAVWQLPATCYVSCETHLRKDDGSAWLALPAIENTPPRQWLHVGDNEHADIQLPQDQGYLAPVHVLRPDALLDVVPALRPLRPPQGMATRWQDQLMLGLITRHLTDIADRAPHLFLQGLQVEDPRSLGYLVLGPLVTDFTCWVARLAQELGAAQILFLAREGHLLHQAFALVQQAAGKDVLPVDSRYLLASRRGVGMPSLRIPADLETLLGNTFQGTLRQLLESRMGLGAAAAVQSVLGRHAMQESIFLPEMRQALLAKLAPAVDALLAVAEDERMHYLAYWASVASNERVLLADIGYSGTIQKHLSRLTGRHLDGAYFCVNKRIAELEQSQGGAWARYGDERNQALAPSDISRFDLLLEALLTSPSGQFLRFRQKADGTLTSEHAPHDLDADGLSQVALIHQGALDFVRDACDVVQQDIVSLDFDPVLAQTPLRCLGEGRWTAGPWLAAMQVKDAYTGRGAVAAVQPR
jgi:hypothetical protein